MAKRYWRECSSAEAELALDLDDVPTRPNMKRYSSGTQSKVTPLFNSPKYNEELEQILLTYLFESREEW